MSTINLGPMIAKVCHDMLQDQGTVLTVETVYARLTETYGDEVFKSERLLAQVAVKQKIKSHLKNAHSINGAEESAQLSLIKDDAPATLAVKQGDGGYAYIPLLMASVEDLDAVTATKKANIKNARASLRKWEKQTGPLRDIMTAKHVTLGEAMKLNEPKKQAAKKKGAA